jgi:hypothetical protein
MRVKGALATAGVAYGAFAVVNYALAYMQAKNQIQPGTNALLDFNQKLTGLNLLTYVLGVPAITTTTTTVIGPALLPSAVSSG